MKRVFCEFRFCLYLFSNQAHILQPFSVLTHKILYFSYYCIMVIHCKYFDNSEEEYES